MRFAAITVVALGGIFLLGCGKEQDPVPVKIAEITLPGGACPDYLLEDTLCDADAGGECTREESGEVCRCRSIDRDGLGIVLCGIGPECPASGDGCTQGTEQACGDGTYCVCLRGIGPQYQWLCTQPDGGVDGGPDGEVDGGLDGGVDGGPDGEADGGPDAGPEVTWKTVSAGGQHTCAIATDSTLWCWGANAGGQLGDDTSEDRLVPTRVGLEADWMSVSAGGGHSCGVRADGSLWCWGWNEYGQLGDNTTDHRPVPTRVGAETDWSSVWASDAHTCGVRAGGQVWCWGWNENGQLGDNTHFDRWVPTREVSAETDWTSVATGAHTCGLRAGGQIWCWGYNGRGAIGDNTPISKSVPTREFSAAADWMTVDAGNWHSCALRAGGQVWCWGAGGVLGDNTTVLRLVPTREYTEGTDWTSVSTGSGHNCGIRAGGQIWCWGGNSSGQLGDNTTDDRLVPTREYTAGTDWTFVSAGGGHSCGVRADGSLWCWGYNYRGGVGDNSTQNRHVPTLVGI